MPDGSSPYWASGLPGRAQGRLSIGVRGALMGVRRGRPIDQQAEQFGAAIVTARSTKFLAEVDMSEVKICNHFAFTSFERLADDLTFRVHKGGEAAAENRPDSATRILHDLGLLIVNRTTLSR